MPQNTQVRWRSVPAAALAWREWDGEAVVFNQRTGSTHLLGELAGEVLRRLIEADRGATIDSLAAVLTTGPDDADADWAGAIAEVLSEFARLGLVRAEAP